MFRVAEDADQLEPVLLVRTQALCLAIPVAEISETCRPMPLQTVEGLPEFVRGVAVVRGAITPVLHVGRLLAGDASLRPGTRLVTARVQGRPVALEVDEVIGVRHLSRSKLAARSLLQGGSLERIGALGVLDGALLAWLGTALLIDPELIDGAVAQGAAY